MYLTIDKLKEYSANAEWVDWFAKYYPYGAELSSVIIDTSISLDFLYWMKTYLYFDEIEQKTYNDVLQIINSDYVYNSNQIFDSYIVTNSYNVHRGQWIHSSEYIYDSEQIFNAKRVKNSINIATCQSINDSTEIVESNSVKNGRNILLSNYVIDSHDIFNSTLITDSTFVLDSTNMTNCHFCTRSKDLTHALFCWQKDSSNYLIFNQPVSEAQWNFAFEEFQDFMASLHLNLFTSWEKEDSLPHITRHLNYNTIMENIVANHDFTEWVGRLPHYDPLIFYGITFDSTTNFEGKKWNNT